MSPAGVACHRGTTSPVVTRRCCLLPRDYIPRCHPPVLLVTAGLHPPMSPAGVTCYRGSASPDVTRRCHLFSVGHHPQSYFPLPFPPPPLPLPCCPFPGMLSSAGLSLPLSLPTFTPSSGAATHHAGLDLLASAALTHPLTSTGNPPPAHAGGLVPPSGALSSQGPYHPAAVLPPKVAKKILDLEYVEMSEISLDDAPPHTPGQPPLPARPPIQNISVWVERFSVMAALLATRFPHKAAELFAYQASIVRAERNFDDGRWVAYDRCFRREALAQKNLDWSIPNARLYNEAFTGRARTVPRCSFCLQEDHAAQACPRNPNRPWFGWLPGAAFSTPSAPQRPPAGRLPQSAECCRRFNDGKCKQTAASCRYAHKCSDCGGPHPRLQCPRSGQRQFVRPRSPSAGPRQPGPPAQPPHPGLPY